MQRREKKIATRSKDDKGRPLGPAPGKYGLDRSCTPRHPAREGFYIMTSSRRRGGVLAGRLRSRVVAGLTKVLLVAPRTATRRLLRRRHLWGAGRSACLLRGCVGGGRASVAGVVVCGVAAGWVGRAGSLPCRLSQQEWGPPVPAADLREHQQRKRRSARGGGGAQSAAMVRGRGYKGGGAGSGGQEQGILLQSLRDDREEGRKRWATIDWHFATDSHCGSSVYAHMKPVDVVCQSSGQVRDSL